MGDRHHGYEMQLYPWREILPSLYANKMFFAEAYPIPRKSDCHQTLDSFVNDNGAMDPLISNGSAEQCGLRTEFERKIQKYQMQHKRFE